MPSLALGPGWTAGMTWRAFSNLSVKIRNYLPSQENALKGLRNIAQGCRAAATLGGAMRERQPQRGCVKKRRGNDDATPLGLFPARVFPRVAGFARNRRSMLRSPFGAKKIQVEPLSLSRFGCGSAALCNPSATLDTAARMFGFDWRAIAVSRRFMGSSMPGTATGLVAALGACRT